jgi:hypothetical protein
MIRAFYCEWINHEHHNVETSIQPDWTCSNEYLRPLELSPTAKLFFDNHFALSMWQKEMSPYVKRNTAASGWTHPTMALPHSEKKKRTRYSQEYLPEKYYRKRILALKIQQPYL